jgi:hypothetical protein
VENKDKFMNRENIREGAIFVHKFTNEVVTVVKPGPFVEVLARGHDKVKFVLPEQYKYYEPYQTLRGSL